MSKYLYLFCELRYIGVKCSLGTQNLVRYTGFSLYRVFVITGFVISGILPIQITAILPGPKILRYNGDFVILGFHCRLQSFPMSCLLLLGGGASSGSVDNASTWQDEHELSFVETTAPRDHPLSSLSPSLYRQ